LLVVGRQVQGSRLCVQKEECSSTGSVMWNMGRVNGQLEKRVWVAWVLFRNEPPFLVEGLDVTTMHGQTHIELINLIYYNAISVSKFLSL
jgi:hypothetical protein